MWSVFSFLFAQKGWGKQKNRFSTLRIINSYADKLSVKLGISETHHLNKNSLSDLMQI